MSRKIFVPLLLLASGVLLSLYAYLGSYTRLMADDYCSVYFASRFNIFRYIWFSYLNWGGRYSAIAVDFFIRWLAPHGLWFFPLVVILLWLAVTFLALRQLLRIEIPHPQSSVLTLALAAFTLATILTVDPLVQQALYWWNGMRTYIPALISATFQIGFLYWAQGKLLTKRKLLAGTLFSFLVAFFSAGFNETFTVVQFLFFTGFTALGLLTNRLPISDPALYLLTAPIVATTLSLLIILTSQGTAIRLAASNNSPNIVTTFVIALNVYWKYLNFLFTTPERVLSWMGLAVFSIRVGTNSQRKETNGWIILIAFGGAILLSFASLVPAAYSFSEAPALRTFIVPTFILVLGLLFAGLMTGQWLANNARFKSSIYADTILTTLVVLLVLASIWLNTAILYGGRETYYGFAERWDSANAQILQAKADGAESVTIPALGNWAKLEEPNQNPKYWVNQCYSLYYGIQVFGPPLNMLAP